MPPPSTAFLSSLSSSLRRPSASFLVPALVATTLGHGSTWLPLIYTHHTSLLPLSPPTRSSSPFPALETLPRRRVLRQLKEGLVKASILVGVPRVIEGLLELNEVVQEGDKDDWCVREEVGRSLDGAGGVDGMRANGEAGLGRIYRDDIGAIWTKMEWGLEDVKWFSKHITYGTFLTPEGGGVVSDPLTSRDPLAHDPALLSIVTLSCLIPQRTHREILWHLRGALRNGMDRDEVEEVQSVVERVCEEMGVKGVGEGMPRVGDIEVQDGEGSRKLPPVERTLSA